MQNGSKVMPAHTHQVSESVSQRAVGGFELEFSKFTAHHSTTRP